MKYHCLREFEYSQHRRVVTALATQVNKCTAVMRKVNFNIMGSGKMMKNGSHLFKFSDFITSLRLFLRETFSFGRTSGLPGAVYDVRLNLNVLLVK